MYCMVTKEGKNVSHRIFTMEFRDLFKIMDVCIGYPLTGTRVSEIAHRFSVKYNCLPFGDGPKGHCYFLAEPETFTVIKLTFGDMIYE